MGEGCEAQMDQKAGFEVHKETEEEYLMVCNLL